MSVNRTHILQARLTPEEMLRVQQNASKLNTSVSVYVRSLLSIPIEVADENLGICTALPNDVFRIIVYDRHTYNKLTGQMARWGGHYNQAVHALNIIKSKRFLPPEDTFILLTKANRLLKETNEGKSAIDEMLGRLVFAEHAPIPPRKEEVVEDEFVGFDKDETVAFEEDGGFEDADS